MSRLPSGVKEDLQRLGFTNLEVEIYVFLLGEAPATGYRVAQAIGKAAANTYAAIQTLQQKGAIDVEAGDTRRCMPVPPDELLARLSREFNSMRARVAAGLKELAKPPSDAGVYYLSTTEQVIERARQMLARVERVAIAVMFPSIATELVPDLERAAARGADVQLKLYAPLDVSGVEVVISSDSAFTMSHAPGQELQLAVDGRECLAAMIPSRPQDRLVATWTRDPLLAVLGFNGLATECAFSDLASRIQAGAPREELAARVRSVRNPFTTLGAEPLARAMRPAE